MPAKKAAKPAAKKPAAKPAHKAPAKAPAKPTKEVAKPSSHSAKAPIMGPKGGTKPPQSLKPLKAPVVKTDPAAPIDPNAEPVPAPKVEKLAEGVLCQIEVLKDGHFFIARTQTESGQAKEFKNTVFEDLLTEMLITLQEQLAD